MQPNQDHSIKNLQKNKKDKQKKKIEVWIDNRFVIRKKLSKGSFGQVYSGTDTHNGNQEIICKINDHEEMNIIEAKIMKELNKAGYKRFPKLYGYGIHKDKPYQIQERFGQTLEYYQ